ncbi:type 4a pilus biogenesis protein PilO [Actinoplanes sp. NPDC049265]|uniref:type 4a pilus biogenesis protein PilO n=1 Tax=Actinoplanes sp. NPDC049265 TaxID=3363902 RepID=UPI0037200BEE
MGARHADRLWMIGGAAVIIALGLMSWFFLINPKYAEAADLRNTTEDTQVQIAVLNKRIADLETEKAKLPQYRAALKTSQNALPSGSGVPDFLRQLQKSGDALHVTVGGVNVNTPTPVDGMADVYTLPIALTLDGTAGDLGKFLTQLQQTQPRAVLIDAVTLAATGNGDAAATSISLSLKAFVAVPAGQGVPSITTTPAK